MHRATASMSPDSTRSSRSGFNTLFSTRRAACVPTPGCEGGTGARACPVTSGALAAWTGIGAGADGAGAGLSPQQILDLAKIFEYDIDFFSDFHPGDAFNAIVEDVRYSDGRRAPGRIIAAELDR